MSKNYKQKTKKQKEIYLIITALITIICILFSFLFPDKMLILFCILLYAYIDLIIIYYYTLHNHFNKIIVYIPFNTKNDIKENINKIISRMNKVVNIENLNFNLIEFKYYSITEAPYLEEKVIITYLNKHGEIVNDEFLD